MAIFPTKLLFFIVPVALSIVGFCHRYCRVAMFKGGLKGGAPPLKLKKNMIFLRKIVIFHTKYTQNFLDFFKLRPLT